MENSSLVLAIILGIVFTAGIIISVSVTWLQTRPKMKAIDVLKAYAEKGEEPPASIVDAINRINWPFPPMPAPQRQTRGQHLSHVAGSLVLAIGLGGVAWWRVQIGDQSWLMLTSLGLAIFFAGAGAARLVAALTTRDER